ncbi:hypothetical protein MHK_009827, partial [Candidatus Magnetomorum sp. HK-1]
EVIAKTLKSMMEEISQETDGIPEELSKLQDEIFKTANELELRTQKLLTDNSVVYGNKVIEIIANESNSVKKK